MNEAKRCFVGYGSCLWVRGVVMFAYGDYRGCVRNTKGDRRFVVSFFCVTLAES